MTVLKCGSRPASLAARFDSADSRPVPSREDRVGAGPQPGVDPRDAEIARLLDRLATRDRDLAAAAVAADAARADALARGRAEGRAEADSREAERLDALRDSLATVEQDLDRKLGTGRDVAIEIAQAALARIVGDAVPYADLVAATARRQATTLLRGTVVRLRVSADDFPNGSALPSLPRPHGRVEVVADPALAAGGCVFDLTLGSLDASVLRQLEAIGAALDRGATAVRA